jgi:hypothetical protein
MRRFSLVSFAVLALVSAPTFAQDCASGQCNLRARVVAPVAIAREVVAVPVQAAVSVTRSVVKTVTVRKPVRTALRGLRPRICK